MADQEAGLAKFARFAASPGGIELEAAFVELADAGLMPPRRKAGWGKEIGV